MRLQERNYFPPHRLPHRHSHSYQLPEVRQPSYGTGYGYRINNKYRNGGIFWVFMYFIFSNRFRLSPNTFNCVEGWWDQSWSSSRFPTLFPVVKLCILCCISPEAAPAVLPSCCPLRGKISIWSPTRTWSLTVRVRPPPSTWRPRTSWSSSTFRRQEVMKHLCFQAVFRIHDILVWIRIRILGSMPLTNGSGSGSCYFRHWPSRCQQKTNFLTQFFLLLLFQR